MLTMRLIIRENGSIYSVHEINRFRKDGKRNTANIEWILDLADKAIEEGMKPTIEFVKYDLLSPIA